MSSFLLTGLAAMLSSVFYSVVWVKHWRDTSRGDSEVVPLLTSQSDTALPLEKLIE